MHEQVLKRKIANALIEDVTANVTVPSIPILRAALGGLWVGGWVTLTTKAVSFSPNGPNRFMQSGSSTSACPSRTSPT
ncbi:hypothetical protein [Agromyces cerinus]|uniref:Uncharacterized protein n=1 Tax=Agromyces cerinus subsp. cerinus TaxID=232089 RepID=A0A1N6I584_9MICO|nr:hypothetical protein [Agromyces cerinus]SIO27198.1 hypothetical protein SAMN05443544_3694 [Agromyces cerinus subsp. cerinus]